MALKALFLTTITITIATAQQQSKSTDDTVVFDASLGGMDIVWLIYSVFALLASLFFVARCGPWNSWCRDETYDGCTEQCYTEIINARGYDASTCGLGDKRPLSLMVLRQDLKEKVIWHHDWKKDFMTFVRNEHALFSTCYAHRDHPFQRKDRRCILVSVLMMDFAIAILLTTAFLYWSFNNTTEFVVDYCISYIFGFVMSSLESLLVGFAVCAATEKCPGCIRDMTKCCGNMVIWSAFMWGLFGFIASVIFIGITSAKDGALEFWQIFALNFVVGLIQAWFLIDLIKMGLQFRTMWKDAHPPPPGPEREEHEKKKKSCLHKCCKVSFMVFCCPIWFLFQCCCRNKPKKDPYDDGQDDYGVNYKEYLAWKTGEEIGGRKLPKTYQMMSNKELAANMQKSIDNKVDKVKGAGKKGKDKVQKTYEANVAGVKKFGTKFKMGVQLKLNKKKGDEVDGKEDDVELVVDGDGDGGN